MIESFLTAFVIYFVVIDPVGSAPIFLSVTSHFTKAERYKVALEATGIALLIMIFFRNVRNLDTSLPANIDLGI